MAALPVYKHIPLSGTGGYAERKMNKQFGISVYPMPGICIACAMHSPLHPQSLEQFSSISAVRNVQLPAVQNKELHWHFKPFIG